MARVIYTRWMIVRDLPQVTAIDGQWGDDEFKKRLRERNCIGMVAERGDEIVGFVVYELHTDRLKLVRFAAKDEGSAQGLLEKLAYKMGQHRRSKLEIAGGSVPNMLSCEMPTIRPEWLTSDVRALCSGECHLPILADALQDAGCEHEQFLSLLRADTAVAAAVYESLKPTLCP
jgi:hypothetical protein